MEKTSNKIHREILNLFKSYGLKDDFKQRQWLQRYLGSNKPTLGLSAKNTDEIIKKIIKENEFDDKSLTELLDSLYKNGGSFEELNLAARLVGRLPRIRKKININKLDEWLNYTCGWAEVDGLCQSNFTAEEVLENWNEWEKLVKKLVRDKNINKRRASLVLLVKAMRQSNDRRLLETEMENIRKLMKEKEVLITKAVSWGLRAMEKFHKKELVKFLKENKESLPKIAYREAMRKVKTGRK